MESPLVCLIDAIPENERPTATARAASRHGMDAKAPWYPDQETGPDIREACKENNELSAIGCWHSMCYPAPRRGTRSWKGGDAAARVKAVRHPSAPHRQESSS